MKNILKFLIAIISFILPLFAFATDNIKITTENAGREVKNEHLENIGGDNFFVVSTTGEKGIKNIILNIARDMRVFVFGFILLLCTVAVIKLVFAENTEEEQKKLRNSIIWSSIGIIVMQIAFSFYKILFDKDVGQELAESFTKGIVDPFINLLTLLASFMFIASAIYAFYKIVMSGGNDEGLKKGKQTIIYSIIGFITIKVSGVLVKNTLDPTCGSGTVIAYGGTNVCSNMTENTKILTTIINWVNSFIAIIVVLLIIYAGFIYMTSAGDDEKQKKSRSIIKYIGIGLVILVMSYIVVTFFLNPESKI